MGLADRPGLGTKTRAVDHRIDPDAGQDLAFISEPCGTDTLSIVVVLGLFHRHVNCCFVERQFAAGVHQSSVVTACQSAHLVIVAAAGFGTSGVVLGELGAGGITRSAVVKESAVRLGTEPIAVTVTGTQVGPVDLGQSSEDVVPYFEHLLREVASVDLQRLDSPAPQGCFGGTELAIFEWTGVTLIFVGNSATPLEDYTFFDFRLDGRAVSDALLGFESSGGARVGDTLERWQALHPDATYFPGESDLIGPTLSLVDGLIALVDPEIGRVTSMSAVSPIFCE